MMYKGCLKSAITIATFYTDTMCRAGEEVIFYCANVDIVKNKQTAIMLFCFGRLGGNNHAEIKMIDLQTSRMNFFSYMGSSMGLRAMP